MQVESNTLRVFRILLMNKGGLKSGRDCSSELVGLNLV